MSSVWHLAFQFISAFILSAAAASSRAPKTIKVEVLTTTPKSYWLSPDNTLSAVQGESVITVWSLPKGKPLFRIEAPIRELATGDWTNFEPLSFSEDGQWLLAKYTHKRKGGSEFAADSHSELYLISVPEEKIVRILFTLDGVCAQNYGLQSYCAEVKSASFTGDGRAVDLDYRVFLPGYADGNSVVKYDSTRLVLSLDGKTKLFEETERQVHKDRVIAPEKVNRGYEQFRGVDVDGRLWGLAADESSCALMDMSARKRIAFLDECTRADNVQLEKAHKYAYSWMPEGEELKIWKFDGTVAARLPYDHPEGWSNYMSPMGDGRYVTEKRRGGSPAVGTFALWDAKTGVKFAVSASTPASDGMFFTPDRKYAAMISSEKVLFARVDAGVVLAPSESGRSAAVDVSAASAAPPAPAPVPEPAKNYDAPPATRMPVDPNAYAVVIGVEKYRQAGIPAVDFAARDARTMYEYLTKSMGFDARNVVLLTDEQATKTDFEKHLGSWLKNRVTADSRVFVYYAGHGAPNPKTGEGYLMPYEADAGYLEDTAFPVTKLYASLAKLPTRDVAVILDACFSGQGGRSLIAKGARPLVNAVKTPAAANAVVLSASESNQISASDAARRHGLLTSYLLEALSGAADAGGDGQITADEIYAYVRPAVERAARLQNLEQTPTMSPEKAAGAKPWIVLKK